MIKTKLEAIQFQQLPIGALVVDGNLVWRKTGNRRYPEHNSVVIAAPLYSNVGVTGAWLYDQWVHQPEELEAIKAQEDVLHWFEQRVKEHFMKTPTAMTMPMLMKHAENFGFDMNPKKEPVCLT